MVDDEEVFDLSRLQKCLREEYRFVNQQKRCMQKEYTSIVSTGDSLFRSLWINGQQWRNLSRLKGGARFSSECVYAANLLDSIPFVDGCLRVGFKEVHYGKFLRGLKDDIAMFKSILIVADELNLETSAFVRAMLTSLYGSCLFPVDQRAVLLIVKSIIEYHLVFSQNPHAIFTGERNSFLNILDVLLQTSCSARAFLSSACKELIMDILLDGSMFWTLEEQELLSVMAVSEVRQKFGEPGSEGTTERIKNHMTQCWAKLTSMINTLLYKVKASLDCLPDFLLWIITYFYKFSHSRGFNNNQSKLMVMRFLFNQIIVPSLWRPQPLLIDTEVQASHVALFNLRKIASILNTIIAVEAGERLLNMAAEAKQFYEKLDRSPLYDIVDALLEKIPKDSELTLPDICNIPGISQTSVLITKSDLDSLVILLNKLKHIDCLSKNTQTQKPCKAERLVDKSRLSTLLSIIEGIHGDISNDMGALSVSEQNESLTNELQGIFHSFNKPLNGDEEVLVISLGIEAVDCPGMLSEEKVLGMPTPKPKRKSIAVPKINMDDVFENLPPSDSDSQESSSDEKAPDEPKAESIETAVDVLCGFDDSFVDLPQQTISVDANNTKTGQPNNEYPFSEFDPLPSISKHSDPFLAVVSQSPASQPSLTTSQSPVPPSTTEPASQLLIDFDELSFPRTTLNSFPPLDASVMATDGGLNSSGSQSSNSSAKRFSSSASSSSDGGQRRLNQPILKRDSHASLISKDKGSGDEVRRRKSLKSNFQNVINNSRGSPKREKKKRAKTSNPFKRKNSSKTSDAIYDSTDVATIIAAGADQEKTAKDICDEIIHKYATIKRARSVSSIPDKPNKENALTQAEMTSHVSRGDEEIMRDAKHKLRLVLSRGSTPVAPFCLDSSILNGKKKNCGDKLITYLRRDLADAVASQDSTMMAELHETLSTLEKLPTSRYEHLLKELQNDYCQRKLYVSYLVRSQQGLMASRQYLEKMLERVERDRQICCRYLMTQCIGMYLENCKEKLDGFIRKFNRLSMPDEKSEEMKNFLQYLKAEFQNDSLWLGSSDKQKSEAMDALERYVIGRVYWTAVYAFGETDKFRDDVFHKSVESMCKSVGEDFSALDIKEEYQLEAPWYPAQYELFALSAYKTPTDKLKCIQRCCTTVMSLLAMSSGSGAVGADAFTPVLIYVVMHANPRGLLTTIDFINSYLSEPLTGEQYYCWMQFCSAIQFIKILLEENSSNTT